ncbi:uncharacterized protein TNCV_2937751 [Trichonephila clavipes]|nr:uncharacterized protein TNCV_2937751 [Trichonephila clavipes]
MQWSPPKGRLPVTELMISKRSLSYLRGKVSKTGQYRRLSSMASQSLTCLWSSTQGSDRLSSHANLWLQSIARGGPWIHEVVSIPIHVHQLDSIGNETRQTRQRVSSHQQSNVGVDVPRRGVKLCVMQSTRVHEWVFGFEIPYQ